MATPIKNIDNTDITTPLRTCLVKKIKYHMKLYIDSGGYTDTNKSTRHTSGIKEILKRQACTMSNYGHHAPGLISFHMLDNWT